ncbi:MAG: hypothetical protein HRT53_19605 [Colwellia sp.]|nr:hypothetical protein [Colwellia sp.]
MNLADALLLTDKLDAYSIQQIRNQFITCTTRIKELIKPQAEDIQIAFKILRYLYIHQKNIEPIRTITSQYGYRYPILEPFFDSQDHSLLNTLEFLESHNLLLSKEIEKSYQCNSCESAFLNFQETCSHCQSSNLKMNELIHHFYCAYVDNKDAFLQGNGEMVCPKCEKTLKHIGADYDKPSIVYHCNDCHHDFQDAQITTTCYNCHSKSVPDDLVHRKIKSFELSALSKHAALYGLENMLQAVVKEVFNAVDFSTFDRFVHIESARIHRYQVSNSCLFKIEISDLESLYLELGEKAKGFFIELTQLIKIRLRSSDLVSASNESTIVGLLIETPEQNSKIVMERLLNDVDQLLKSSINFHVPISSKLQPITKSIDANELMGLLL